jgi:nucleolar protein 56
MRLVTTWFGAFIMDGGRVESHRLFPLDPRSIADRLSRVGEGEILDEEAKLAERYGAGGGGAALEVEEHRLASLGTVAEGPMTRPEPDEHGVDPSLLREATLLIGQDELGRGMAGDWHVMQAVDTLDDITRAMNSLAERLRGWYSPHWPELEKEVDDPTYARVVCDFGSREALISGAAGAADGSNVPEPGPEEAGPDIGRLASLASSSAGAAMDEAELEAVKGLAAAYLSLAGHREELEGHLRGAMEGVAPNLSELAGPLIGARLIRLAGGMERLARLPSSTVQVLGAEKALFSHLREGTRPPKHGIIFQHPIIHTASWWQRGRIARHFAGKLAIAARSDHYGGTSRGSDLLEAVTRRAEEVRRELPEPPKGRSPPPPPGSGRHGPGGRGGGGRGDGYRGRQGRGPGKGRGRGKGRSGGRGGGGRNPRGAGGRGGR